MHQVGVGICHWRNFHLRRLLGSSEDHPHCADHYSIAGPILSMAINTKALHLVPNKWLLHDYSNHLCLRSFLPYN